MTAFNMPAITDTNNVIVVKFKNLKYQNAYLHGTAIIRKIAEWNITSTRQKNKKGHYKASVKFPFGNSIVWNPETPQLSTNWPLKKNKEGYLNATAVAGVTVLEYTEMPISVAMSLENDVTSTAAPVLQVENEVETA